MFYLYHKVPKGMKGSVLYPLNQLKNIDEDLYKKQNAKYEGREDDTNINISKLDCGWNDVIHFSAVDLDEIYKELKILGKNWKPKFFKVDPDKLDLEKTVVLIPPHRKDWEPGFRDEDFVKFDPKDMEKYSIFPEETKEYYKMAIDAGKLPMTYHRIPHILYKGTIDISDVEVVEVNK